MGKRALGRALVLLVGLVVGLAAQAQLNDTGVDQYSNSTSFTLTEPADFPGQDPSYGRDAAAAAGMLPKIGGGASGFDFTKIANDGSELPADATLGVGPKKWACTRDNVTGRMWEMKTNNGGLRDKDWRYSWYSTNRNSNGGNAGNKTPGGNPGICGSKLINCNTQEYTAAVNRGRLCGHSDWRLPTIEELRSIVDYGIAYPGPTIDAVYFPNTANDLFFWSSSVGGVFIYPLGVFYYAWVLGFGDGHDGTGHKGSDANHVRLVRGRPPPAGWTPSGRPGCVNLHGLEFCCLNSIPASTPTRDFTLDWKTGVAVHNETDLMWMRCPLGQSWNGWTCTGSAVGYTWQEALQRAASATFTGYDDWRLPNIKELASIVEWRCLNPAINTIIFPNTPSGGEFWTSSVDPGDPKLAWHRSFGFGGDYSNADKSGHLYVRLVRGGQCTREER